MSLIITELSVGVRCEVTMPEDNGAMTWDTMEFPSVYT
jgi:hypothetical protein